VSKAIVTRLNVDLHKALGTVKVRTTLIEMGLEPKGDTPAQFADHVSSELAQWSDVERRAKIRVD
jgi:tripartite-type tricarboxylate transporter receptor subunit TctC